MKKINLLFFILLGIISCDAQNPTTSRKNAFENYTQQNIDSQAEETIPSSGETYYVINQAQVNTAQLAGTKWKKIYSDENDMITTWEFTSEQIVRKTVTPSWTSDYTSPFYITNKEPKEFDKSMVGKNGKGCYLAKCIGKDRERLDWYTIMSFDLTNGEMTLYRKAEPDEIGGGDAIIYLKLISKSTGSRGRR